MWLLESDTREALEQAQNSGSMPTAEQQASHIQALSDGGARILNVAGNSAEISIKGTLTKTPSFLAMLFGGGNTTYLDINNAIASAEQDDNISDITLAIDSPGGSVDGLFDTLAVIQSAKKPIVARVSNLAASAAFAIASQADKIISENHATRFGSIGILASFNVNKFTVKIASTKAPKKSPDVTTTEGVEMVREELDALHEIFVDAIASGRGVSTNTVNAKFGQGGVLLAGEALKRGMIDSMAKTPLQSVENTKTKAAADGGDNLKVKVMDLAKLKAEHPEAYAAAVQVGFDDGVTHERDRVGAHLTMGEASGDMVTAVKACKDGNDMTATLQAAYMAAGMNRSDTQARGDDNNDAGDGTNDDDNNDADTDAETIAASLEARFGTEVK